MEPKLLKALFGTDVVDDIVKSKQSKEPKARALVSKKTSQVTLSPDECKSLCNKAKIEYLEGYEERVFQYTMTDETVDRYGDIVVANGVDLKNYKNNPVVLAFHNLKQLPVGSSIKVWYEASEKAVKAWCLFYDDRVDKSGVCDTVFNFVKSGAMRTGSIGFMPVEYEYPSEKDREKLDMPQYGVLYTKTELLEFSVTPVPANPSAEKKTIESLERGLYSLENIEKAKKEKAFDDKFLDTLKELLEKADKYECECIDCNYKMESSEHCKDLKCPECGGQMRRAERPGPGEDGKDVDVPEGKRLDTANVIVTLDGFEENLTKLIDAITMQTNKQILLTEKLDMFSDNIKKSLEAYSGKSSNSGMHEPENDNKQFDKLLDGIEDVLKSYKN